MEGTMESTRNQRTLRRWATIAWLAVAVAAIAAPAVAADLTVSLSFDGAPYAPGETLTVRAMVTTTEGSPVDGIRRARVVVIDPSGQRAFRDGMDVEGGGVLVRRFSLEDDAPTGTWTATVEAFDSSRNGGRASGTFEVGDGTSFCPDGDGDGYQDASCGGRDCDDGDPTVHPGASETCGDGLDQDCDGLDLPCGDPHASLVWNGAETCLQCHEDEAVQVHGSVMYQWEGDAPDMDTGPARQGKAAGAVNSYCVNIAGNWGGCGGCHVGLGERPSPDATAAQLANVDCMLCHQQAYRRKKVDGRFVPDEAAMGISMDEAARTVHRPERVNCLQCHAKAGGGDSVKRGDLTLAHGSTSDQGFDVHMATTGANLRCQDCHTVTDHRFAGKGSDLRPTDSPVELECSNCHGSMASGGHEGEDLDRHTARVACQTCHIPVYAKNAADSAASEATEVHRTWLDTHATSAPFHPANMTANDLVPEYRFWNRRSRNYLLHDAAEIDPATGRYPTSRPLGDVADPEAKLYAFKYKTAEQPLATAESKLIAIDTSVYFATADAAAAVEQGLENMGLPATTAYEWVETDTFQMLNHEVSPSEDALGCNDCHGRSARVNLVADLGYGLKGDQATICVQCHGQKSDGMSFAKLHDKHVKDKRYDCSWCHGFSRPERGLRMP